jgi:hypothetical protein
MLRDEQFDVSLEFFQNEKRAKIFFEKRAKLPSIAISDVRNRFHKISGVQSLERFKTAD